MPATAPSVPTSTPTRAPMPAAKAVLLAGLFAALFVSGAAASDLTTPEAAVAAYLDGVASHDLAAVLAASAVEPMSEQFDFPAYVDRYQALNVAVPVPATDPMLVAINRANFTAQIVRQVQFLTYGLLSTVDIDQGRPLPMDAAAASAFAAEIDLSRLEALVVRQIGEVELPADKQPRYRANAAAQAVTYGAYEQVERGAVLDFEGASYLVGFTLLRYGDTWGVSSQSSALLGTSSLGAPQRVTP
ncbi:hypothetical protein [Devosia sp. FKR38]|uniref:hypothetical protein n=1 Tax=Devosia sp. FKR38 TaxID=2562312 RepID=UPI0010C07449|nr:hypothetical protein [Devosia sp. FKR38]